MGETSALEAVAGSAHRDNTGGFVGAGLNLFAQPVNVKRTRIWKPVRVLGLEGAYVLGWGQKRPVMVAVDLGEGEPVAISYLDEHNPEAVRRWLEPGADGEALRGECDRHR